MSIFKNPVWLCFDISDVERQVLEKHGIKYLMRPIKDEKCLVFVEDEDLDQATLLMIFETPNDCDIELDPFPF
jgi:hypothetical protein